MRVGCVWVKLLKRKRYGEIERERERERVEGFLCKMTQKKNN